MAKRSLMIAGIVIILFALSLITIEIFDAYKAAWVSTPEQNAKLFGDFTYTLIVEAILLAIGVIVFIIGVKI